MCGGRGTRLDTRTEKLLVEVGGVPMVDRAREALAASRVGTTHAVVSPQAPATRDHLAGDLPLVETPGEGYVSDLGTALDRVGRPALTVAADLPLLAGDAVDRVLDEREHGREREGAALAVQVPARLKRALGASVDYETAWVPAGVNVAADGEDATLRTWDARLAVNVNRKRDLAAAERLLDDGP